LSLRTVTEVNVEVVRGELALYGHGKAALACEKDEERKRKKKGWISKMERARQKERKAHRDRTRTEGPT
jgi:hypothetical protein